MAGLDARAAGTEAFSSTAALDTRLLFAPKLAGLLLCYGI